MLASKSERVPQSCYYVKVTCLSYDEHISELLQAIKLSFVIA